MNIGVITICTGKYVKYIEGFTNSVNNNFLKNHNLLIFIFTDSVDKLTKKGNVFLIPEIQRPWPYSTLLRFHLFCENYRAFNGCDVLYFMDGDMLVDKEVTEDILPDKDRPLCAVEHPGFWSKKNGTFEIDKRSTACVNPNDRSTYFQGCFFGGFTKDFIKMSFACQKNIDIDLSNNIIATWHDESHMNRYFIYEVKPKPLPPMYAYPENCGNEKFGIPKEWKILHLQKNNEEMRKNEIA